MAGVWILADNHDQILELLAAGRSLADDIGMGLHLLLWDREEKSGEYFSYGADEIILLPALADGQPLSVYIPLIAEEAAREKPEVFLIGGSNRCKELAARIATRLETGLCSECTAFHFNQDLKRLEMERMIYGGVGVQTVASTSKPQMATIPPRTFSPGSPLEGREGKTREITGALETPVRVLEKKAKSKEQVNIREAKVVVCVGRGLENEEDLQLARELAEVLGGEVACTRPIAEELHWLPEETYIGLSGQVIKPHLYIGIGVSGQIQHTVGIRDAKTVIAINRDENAAIFEVADYGIIGDLYEVVPQLTRAIKEKVKS